MKSLTIAILFLFLFAGCEQSSPRFTLVPSGQSGLAFHNTLSENDSMNILENDNLYNGSGVALGDINGDGLDDIFLAGNMVDNALYINKGNLQFEDIAHQANIQKPDPLYWSSGVTMVDINHDGRLDIYVCNTLRQQAKFRKNFLYINQGNDANGVPSFIESAEKYGLADTSHSSHCQFFDYDRDGDLDLYIGVNYVEVEYPNSFVDRKNDGTEPNTDLLYQNNRSDSLNHPVFTNVSQEAGIVYAGYSHSTLIHDFNGDHWPDIYVANDYQTDDLIYINNQDGTFTEQAGEIFKHFSLSSMGSDAGDINNDGHMDIYTSEMQPYHNQRKKLFNGRTNYKREIFTRQYKYNYQYGRNMLQLYRGLNPQDSTPIYSEIGMYAGVQESDWSWSVLFADYDNDGWQDLYITNGYPKDVTDHDFSTYRVYANRLVSQEKLIEAIPEVKISNFMFKNNGDYTFSNATQEWRMDIPSFSNGAAYGDLDQDGDLDLVVNNINDPVFLFENHSADQHPEDNYLRIRLTGSDKNRDAIGASVEIFAGSSRQIRTLLSGRGYLSKSENTLHFGLGERKGIDSARVTWPDGSRSWIGETEANQVINISFDADPSNDYMTSSSFGEQGIFTEADSALGLRFTHQEIDFIDFNFQRTLPRKFSQQGPSLAAGDVNGDGLEDLFVSGGGGMDQHWFLQQSDGSFSQRTVTYKNSAEKLEEDAGTLLFDAYGDGNLDLYIARGGGQYEVGHEWYRDILLINDGTGRFFPSTDALPDIRANSTCVKAADYDLDDDLDLFIGGGILPHTYPFSDRAVLLENVSGNGQIKFKDATPVFAPDLEKTTIINDAVWADINGDDRPDLIIASEWMPVQIYENHPSGLSLAGNHPGLDNKRGWWQSIESADLDNDGDLDLIAGNYGENNYYRCSAKEPVRVYAADLDGNGSIDPVITCYWQDSTGQRHEYPYHPYEDISDQYVGIKKVYQSFGAYGNATMDDIKQNIDFSDAKVLSVNWMKSVWIENRGREGFEVHSLPVDVQFAPVNDIAVADINGDGYTDILMVGNDHGLEVRQGRSDAFNGAVLLNQGGKKFVSIPVNGSHFMVPGDARSIVVFPDAHGRLWVVAGQNNDRLKAFILNNRLDEMQ